MFLNENAPGAYGECIRHACRTQPRGFNAVLVIEQVKPRLEMKHLSCVIICNGL